MSILSFIKEAGEKLLRRDPPPASAPAADVKAANDEAGDAIKAYIEAQGLKATGLTVTYDGATGTVTDQMTVEQSAPEAQYYTVVKGDNLSKISKQYYGDPNKYTKIFEANKPMLKSPDLIYPGQVLRIPPA